MPTVRTLPASILHQARASTTLANNTTKNVDLTVPNGKRWLVYMVNMTNGDDVDRSCNVFILDGSGNTLHVLGYATISAGGGSSKELLGGMETGTNTTYFRKVPILVKGGNKLRLTWNAGGASSGGTSYYCVTYEELTE